MKQETTNTFDKGLNKDLNSIVTPNDLLTDSLNGTFITFNGDELSLQNDSGNTTIPIPGTKDVVKLSPGFYPLGIREYGGVLYIVSGKKGENGEKDLVEFGSYPAPKFLDPGEYNPTNTARIFDPKVDLYKSKVLNDAYFKSGGYARFTNVGGLDLSNVSTETESKIYNVRLLHQLDNGIFDLSRDVWESFLKYRGNDLTPKHWLNAPNFKYFCPTQYKGKLAISVELTEPEEFEFSVLPYALESAESYEIKYKVHIKNNEDSPLQITDYKLLINDVDYGNKPSIKVPIETKRIKYTLIPILNYDWKDLPSEFKNKFTISGEVSLASSAILFQLVKEDSACGIESRMLETNIMTLWDLDNPVDLNLNPIEQSSLGAKTIFINKDYDTTEKPLNFPYNILGTFKVVNGEAIIHTFDENNLAKVASSGGVNMKSKLETLLNNTKVIEANLICASFHIHIKFNAPLKMIDPSLADYYGPLLFTDASTGMPLVYNSKDGRTFTVHATEGIDIIINTGDSKETLWHTSIEYGKTYNFGVVTYWYPTSQIVSPSTIVYWNSYRTSTNTAELLEYCVPKIVFEPSGTIEFYKIESTSTSINHGPRYDNLIFKLTNITKPSEQIFKGFFQGRNDGDMSHITDGEYINLIAGNSNGYVKFGNEELGYLILRHGPILNIDKK